VGTGEPFPVREVVGAWSWPL